MNLVLFFFLFYLLLFKYAYRFLFTMLHLCLSVFIFLYILFQLIDFGAFQQNTIIDTGFSQPRQVHVIHRCLVCQLITLSFIFNILHNTLSFLFLLLISGGVFWQRKMPRCVIHGGFACYVNYLKQGIVKMGCSRQDIEGSKRLQANGNMACVATLLCLLQYYSLGLLQSNHLPTNNYKFFFLTAQLHCTSRVK